MHPLILLHSDLHLESGAFTLPASPAVAVAVFAGDVCSGTEGPARLAALTALPKVYVAGNHEFWGGDYFERLAALKASAAAHGVHFLENSSVVVAGVRFLGATLWTDYAQGHEALMAQGLWGMRDHQKITAQRWWTPRNRARFLKQFGAHALERFDGNFNPLLALDLHRKTRAWLVRELAKPFDGDTVIVTHHAPHFESLRRSGISDYALTKEAWVHRRNDDLGLTRVGSYASNILADLHDDLQRARVRLWCHGHLHHAMHYGVEGIQVAANPRGRVHPPLTEESARAFALFGIGFRAEDIERSQQAHRDNPEQGDGVGYAKDRVFSLEDSGYSVLRPLHEEVRDELALLASQLKQLRPLANSTRDAVADLAAHRADTLWAAVLASVRKLTKSMLEQLYTPYRFNGDLSHELEVCRLAERQQFAGLENRGDYTTVLTWKEIDARRTPAEREVFGWNEEHYSARRHLKTIEKTTAQLMRQVRRVPQACQKLRIEQATYQLRMRS